MTQKIWGYIMDARIQQLRLSRKITMICHKCDQKIIIGDKVYSRNASSSKSKSKLYHEECAKMVNIL